MTPKTKQEALRLIDELKAKIDELPDEGRPVTEGWEIIAPGVLCRADQGGLHYTVATAKRNGLFLSRLAHPALDGIDHDDKGRIKVVGYVNAEELEEGLKASGFYRISSPSLFKVIDELEG